jgi:hypothetical protein
VKKVGSLTNVDANDPKDDGGTADVKKQVAMASEQFERLSSI